ncbi:MAG: hypothetical protein PHS27_00835 [Candidatus Pacebacteria bacterium]|nr:hypothetical protein [Candidatus Paceibacterota bacterium]
MVIKKKKKPKKVAKKPAKKRIAKKKVAKRVIVRKKTRKPIRKKKIAKPVKIKESEGKPIGRVVHYFDHIGVAVIKLTSGLAVKNKIQIVGGDIDFKQEVKSMQIEHRSIKKAKAKDEIGLKIGKKVRPGYRVFKI